MPIAANTVVTMGPTGTKRPTMRRMIIAKTKTKRAALTQYLRAGKTCHAWQRPRQDPGEVLRTEPWEGTSGGARIAIYVMNRN